MAKSKAKAKGRRVRKPVDGGLSEVGKKYGFAYSKVSCGATADYYFTRGAVSDGGMLKVQFNMRGGGHWWIFFTIKREFGDELETVRLQRLDAYSSDLVDDVDFTGRRAEVAEQLLKRLTVKRLLLTILRSRTDRVESLEFDMHSAVEEMALANELLTHVGECETETKGDE